MVVVVVGTVVGTVTGAVVVVVVDLADLVDVDAPPSTLGVVEVVVVP